MNNKLCLALCDSRHAMPACVVGSIFPNTCNMDDVLRYGVNTAIDRICEFADKCGMIADETAVYFDRHTGEELHTSGRLDAELCVYVTGFTPCICAVVNACLVNGWHLTLMHFDRETGEYLPQRIY